MKSVRQSPRIPGVVFVALALCLALPAPSAAGPIVQNVQNEARNISPFEGQTFTAEDALIGIAGVYVRDFTFCPTVPLIDGCVTVATDPDVVYDLYAGVYLAGGTLLATRTFSGLVEGFNGFADVSFAGLSLVVGNTYSLVVSNDTFQWGVDSAFIADYYTGGAALLPFAPGDSSRDLRFHVLPDSIPEPATLVLLGVGLAAAGMRRRMTA